MSQKNYYELLGVAENATPLEIKAAFKRRARELHPDANGGSPAHEEKFKALSAAHDVLKDRAQRAAYDASLRNRRAVPPRPRRRRTVRKARPVSAPSPVPTAAAVVAPAPMGNLGVELLRVVLEALIAGFSTNGRGRSPRTKRRPRPRRRP
jgi:curved DNA-binding protein CbpA